ncbi:MAG: hypothetical protein GIW94_06575 [Candidatus Eremiobacteraeota bacterium]|nr:hypothetical protein [Candidatus Eremiobacteraeota bacterium]MBC5822481.1 hypothetical protein [Candidatus Eremiobacteraeota bacterium]
MFALLLASALASPAMPRPLPTPALTPPRILGLIRAKFRSHRPPPPYETYVLTRKENTSQGFPNYADSYTYKYWCRTSDKAALKRQVYRSINRGTLEFERPAFNEAEDPGPPTADLFEPAPLRSRPVTFVPTPEPTGTAPPLIGVVRTVGEFDYRVVSLDTQGGTLHLHLEPTRDPDRNRLRDLYVDKKTYELQKVVATDKLFILGSSDVYGTTFTISLAMLDGRPVVTDIHGVVGDGYTGDGATVDYTFRDIAFPATLPAWYFDAHDYAEHVADAPI